PSVLSIASMAWRGGGQPPDTLEGDDDDEDGLVAGGEAPSFEAESIDGGARSLDELRRPGLPTLMVFADPGCGSCIALLPDVARWQRELTGELTIVVVASGEREEIRAEAEPHAVANVVIQRDRAVS